MTRGIRHSVFKLPGHGKAPGYAGRGGLSFFEAPLYLYKLGLYKNIHIGTIQKYTHWGCTKIYTLGLYKNIHIGTVQKNTLWDCTKRKKKHWDCTKREKKHWDCTTGCILLFPTSASMVFFRQLFTHFFECPRTQHAFFLQGLYRLQLRDHPLSFTRSFFTST